MWKVYEDYLNRVFLPLTKSTRLHSLFKAYDQEKGHGCKFKGSKKIILIQMSSEHAMNLHGCIKG
jgi:hypothetical protein